MKTRLPIIDIKRTAPETITGCSEVDLTTATRTLITNYKGLNQKDSKHRKSIKAGSSRFSANFCTIIVVMIILHLYC